MHKELSTVYRLIADLLRYPDEIDRGKLASRGRGVIGSLAGFDPEAAELIRRFMQESSSIDTEQYVDTFELAPKCPLYLGYYGFQEPATCASAGDSERNRFMLEMANIYRHYGLSLEGKELPDFLPAVVEFLWLTPSKQGELPRSTLISEFVAPYLPKVVQRLEQIHSPYAGLLKALDRLIHYELDTVEEVADAQPIG